MPMLAWIGLEHRDDMHAAGHLGMPFSDGDDAGVRMGTAINSLIIEIFRSLRHTGLRTWASESYRQRIKSETVK